MKFASVLFAGWLPTGLLLYPGVAVAEEPMMSVMNWAILFLIAMPYTIGGSIGAWIVYSHLRVVKR